MHMPTLHECVCSSGDDYHPAEPVTFEVACGGVLNIGLEFHQSHPYMGKISALRISRIELKNSDDAQQFRDTLAIAFSDIVSACAHIASVHRNICIRYLYFNKNVSGWGVKGCNCYNKESACKQIYISFLNFLQGILWDYHSSRITINEEHIGIVTILPHEISVPQPILPLPSITPSVVQEFTDLVVRKQRRGTTWLKVEEDLDVDSINHIALEFLQEDNIPTTMRTMELGRLCNLVHELPSETSAGCRTLVDFFRNKE